MNRFGLWGDSNFLTYSMFQNGYHQYEIFEYLGIYIDKDMTISLIDELLNLRDQNGHFAPYLGGGSCYDYDAVHLLTYPYLNNIFQNKISKTKLGNYNIEIKYDKRLDKTKHHKKYSFQSLSKLAVKENNEQSIFHVKDFNDYVDIFSINNAFGLQSYWFQELSCNSYNSLANSYSFLQTNIRMDIRR